MSVKEPAQYEVKIGRHREWPLSEYSGVEVFNNSTDSIWVAVTDRRVRTKAYFTLVARIQLIRGAGIACVEVPPAEGVVRVIVKGYGDRRTVYLWRQH